MFSFWKKKEIKQSKTKKRKRNLASLHLSIQTLIFFPLFVFVVVEEEFSLLRCVFNIFFFFCWKIQVFLPLKNSIRCLMWCDVYVIHKQRCEWNNLLFCCYFFLITTYEYHKQQQQNNEDEQDDDDDRNKLLFDWIQFQFKWNDDWNSLFFWAQSMMMTTTIVVVVDD